MRFVTLLVAFLGAWMLSFPSLRAADTATDAEDAIVQLHASGALYDKNQYRTVRAAFAKLFEAKHADAITETYGEDYEALTKWFDAHADLKQNFYTALDDRYDKIDKALSLFRAIWRKFPAELEKHPDLGIAVAVVWDDPRGVYDFRSQQHWTKSKMPEGQIDGLANFQYVVENEKVTEGRCRYMPWEFLVFVVDHPTSLSERKWAQQYYKSNRTAKSWHQDVPYDHDMLKFLTKKDESFKPKLADREYTLGNIKKYGGVCANQADFAARVAKSVGIPAVYCSGESAYRGSHAWWMYVTIQKATADTFQFTLNSDGRFVGFVKDAYYTGNVRDPQTGRDMLDRDMERRLTLAGRDRAGKRQASLAMRAYPWLAAKLKWDVKQRVTFLDKCLHVCPRYDEGWLEFVKLIKEGDLPAEQNSAVRLHVTSALITFKDHPDFLARLFTDLLSVFDPAEQVRLHQQAVALFEKAGRPDLSCAARLQITDALVAQKKWQTAADGLTTTITRFPTEGRYVPKMTAKMQEVCSHYKGGNEKLAKLYIDLVPKLIAYYGDGDDLAKFHTELYKQALAFLKKNDMQKQEAELKGRAGR
jgi:hypothetical protein